MIGGSRTQALSFHAAPPVMPMLTAPFFPLLVPVAGAAAGAGVGLVLRRLVIPRLVRLAAVTETRVDDVILASLRGPVLLWSALVGLYLGIALAPVEPRVIDALRGPILAVVIVSVSWTVARLTGSLIGTSGGLAAALPSARILTNAAQAVVLGLGVLVALQTLGISVAPLLTALGVGGLAVGLALQDTLANLFAGLHILMSRQVRPGDFVRLSSGEEGFVVDISWRNTTIRQLPNDIVIVPNAQLAKSVTVNYTLPEPEQAVLVQVGVGYDEDLQHVEQVLVGVARGVQRGVDGAVPTFEPFIRYHTFGESSIDCTVILRARAFTDRYLMTHEFVKRVHARFRAEGITIPYPQRTLHLDAPAAADPLFKTPGPSVPRVGSPR